MPDEKYEKLVGRISALEMIMIYNEMKSLKGSSSAEITEAAKKRADFWSNLGDALEVDSSDVVDAVRKERLEKLGTLLVDLTGPVSKEIEDKLKKGEI